MIKGGRSFKIVFSFSFPLILLNSYSVVELRIEYCYWISKGFPLLFCLECFFDRCRRMTSERSFLFLLNILHIKAFQSAVTCTLSRACQHEVRITFFLSNLVLYHIEISSTRPSSCQVQLGAHQSRLIITFSISTFMDVFC